MASRHVENTFYEVGGFVGTALDPRKSHSGEGCRIATQIRSILDAASINFYFEEFKHTYNTAEVPVPAPYLPASPFFVGLVRAVIPHTLRKTSAWPFEGISKLIQRFESTPRCSVVSVENAFNAAVSAGESAALLSPSATYTENY